MDPITAFTAMVQSLMDLLKTIIEGQPPEVKAQMWKWYVEDVARWRKFFKVD